MRIRLPHDLHDKLARASEYFGIDKSTIIRKALRKAHSAGVVTCENNKRTTRKESECYRFDVPEELYVGMSHSKVRDVIEWYLDLPQHSTSKPKPRLDLEKPQYMVIP